MYAAPERLLEVEFLGNALLVWLSAAGVVLVALLALAIAIRVLRNRLAWVAERTSNRLDDGLVKAVDGTRLWLLFFVVLFFALRPLELPPRVDHALRVLALLAVFLQLGLWVGRLLDHWFDDARMRAMSADASTATSMVAFKFVGRVLLWSVVLMLALDNLGVDITALIAGLGVGGIAVALAVQNVLGDLFASMSILVDKPFVIGDFIVVGDYMGSVEHIGLKTTRIRSLGGEQLIFANSDLLSTRIRNYKRMNDRRIVFHFGVLYQTTPEQLERIPRTVREIIEAEPSTRFDRAHFKGFGESSYDFEVVYWVLSPDFNVYMDAQQRINLALVRAFAAVGVEFAYPTRTLLLQRPGRGAGTQPATAGQAG